MLRSIARWIAYPLIAGVLVLVIGLLVGERPRPVEQQIDPTMTIAQFDGDYTLEPQPDGTLDALVTETISVDFKVQGRHGIIRQIPLRYGTHMNTVEDVTVDAQVRELQAEPGAQAPAGWAPIQFDVHQPQDEEDPDVVVKIGSENATLHKGMQRYRLSYRLTDIAIATPDRRAQEVYLDVNGTGWSAVIVNATGRIHVPATLADSLNGNAACYYGQEGSTQTCQMHQGGTDPVTFTGEAGDLGPGHTLTIAVGFVPGTFPVAYTPAKPFPEVVIWLTPMPLIGLIVLLCKGLPPLWKKWRRARRVIVTEFQPPKGLAPLIAADVCSRPERGMAAQLIQEVLDGNVRLTTDAEPHSEAAASSSSPTRKQVRQVRNSILVTKNPSLPDTGVGGVVRGYYTATRLGSAFSTPTLLSTCDMLVEDAGMRADSRPPGRWFIPGYLGLLLGIGLMSLGALMTSSDNLTAAIVSGVAAVVLLVAALYREPASGPLTDKGEAVYQRLRGLENFMTMSEADRISWLQSTETAPRVAEGDATLIKLYEPLLPYAVIFGIEDSWAKLIGEQHATFPEAATWRSAVDGLDLGVVLRSVGDDRHDNYHGGRTMSEVNSSVGHRFRAAGKSLFSGDGSGRSDGGSGSSSVWSGSSGGSGGGGRAGGGMGGGGGSSW